MLQQNFKSSSSNQEKERLKSSLQNYSTSSDAQSSSHGKPSNHGKIQSHPLLKMHTREEFEELKEETGCCWAQLPDSVIGTLIYFLMVEHNDSVFKVMEFIRCLLIIGLPVYLTYFFQWTILYQLWVTLPALGDVVNSGLCTSDVQIELAASSVFFIFIFDNCTTILKESFIVLRCERVAFIEHELEDEISVVKLHTPMAKRIFIWFTVCLFEILLLLALCVVGTQYILTSQTMTEYVLNSVAIVFVMDIDNFARDAFQNDIVSEHVDSVRFDTKMKESPEEKFEGLDHKQDNIPVPLSIYMTFWSLEKAAVVLILTFVLVFVLRHYNC